MAVAAELPEPLIQLIQSFLTTKEAAQTALLSQSWLGAWLTRPNLDFDERDFRYETDPFLQFANKTFDRYENSNLKIHTFSLRMKLFGSNFSDRVTKLIQRALRFGPTRLSFDVGSTCRFVLPNEVFSSETLVELTVDFCRIDLGPNTKVGCSKLRSLTLNNMSTESRDLVFRIVESCPLIEELSLRSLVKPRDGGSSLLKSFLLPRLRSLVLDDVRWHNTSFLGDLSSKFPSLEDLTLCTRGRGVEEDVLISSPSLVRLDLKIERFMSSRWPNYKIQRVEFDVPSIRKLTFRGSIVPSLAGNRPNSMGWESDDRVSGNGIHLTANNIDFLGERFLQRLDVRIENLSKLMYGSNDLKEARAQVFDEDASMWRDVPLLPDSTIPENSRDFRFKLIWQTKQKKLNQS